jgi:tRNA(Ile2)-agmatinylcytidine synthase
MSQETIHIGLDDTDSTRKGCTTYVAALLVEKLQKLGASFIDYPSLIRLNPNVPWKTRGNGALSLRIICNKNSQDEIREIVLSTVEQNSDLESTGTDPGVVFLEKTRMPKEIRTFARKAITGIVTLREASKLLKRHHGEAVGFKEGRGIIGGLAAIGETLLGDHTYEILAYRIPENYGLKRRVDDASIFMMDEATAPYTFNNVDTERRRVIITPRGPDPILFGIRGETPEIVKKGFEMVKPLEPIERWVIFRSNQGTDAHLQRVSSLSQLKPYNSVIARAAVAANPKMIRGKHVIFQARDKSAKVDCAAYEPSGALNRVARELALGDEIEVYGSVRVPRRGESLTVNLEKIRLLKLAPRIVYRNPICPNCEKRMKSMGRDKGFRCEKCRLREPEAEKVELRMKRDIEKGLYITSVRSQRHLTKPLVRYGMEKRHGTRERLLEVWHFP